MLLSVFHANTDLPPIGFCNEPLLGSKYDGLPMKMGVNRIALEVFQAGSLGFTSQGKGEKQPPLKNPHEIHQLIYQFTN
jgi:hypothetical protein